MAVDRKQSHGRRSLLWAVALTVLLSVPVLQRSDTRTPMGPSKLTTVLADLSRSIPQELGPVSLTSDQRAAEFNPRAMPKSALDAVRGHLLRLNSNAEVQVYILMSAVTDENLRVLKANGVTIEISAPAQHRVQARVPVTRLQIVGALPFVNFVRLPTYAVHMTGSVDTEGDVILRAEQARQQFLVDGTGVKVGAISDGLKGVFDTNCTSCSFLPGGPMDPAKGDLPLATGTRNSSGVLTSSTGGITASTFTGNNDLEGIIPSCGFAGAGAEGTALLEIIHDIAPGAQLSFANADTDIAFNQAVNKLAASNDVVMDDLAFIGLAADGTSDVSTNTANALNSAVNPIRAYVTSVGNTADGHYYGTYTDSGVNGTTVGLPNGDLHLFQQSADTTDVLGLGPKPYNVIDLPTSGEVIIFLVWDDPFGASNNNYDLYLVQESTGKVVDQSTDPQTGSQDPVEFIDYTNPGAEDKFHIVVQNVGNLAAAKHLNLYSFEPECASAGPKLLAPPLHERVNYNTATRSVPAQSDAGGTPASVISVGAICSASAAAQNVFNGAPSPDESCLDTTNSTIEYFSSQGPTLDGRNKPDISGIDGVSVTGAGNFENPFFGTSAAAPHIAGIAALLLQSKQCLLNGVPGALDVATARTDLRSLILGNAVPLPSGGTSPNNTFGAGRADAFASTNATVPVFSGASPIYVSGNSPNGASLANLDPSQLGFPEPATCPMATLSWTGDCGSGQSSSINCGFGTQNVTVKASNNSGLSFSPLVNLQLVVTNFSLAPAPPGSTTVRAGLSATYTLYASAQGGSFNNAVTLSCSKLPTGAACTFNPPTVTPGSQSAAFSMAISTTGSALTPPALGAPPSGFGLRGVPLFAILLALAAFTSILVVGTRRAKSFKARGLATAGALSLVLAFLLIQPACGSQSSPPPSPVSTPAGSYQVTVTGTAGSLTQTSTVTLVVQ
ncbi:MAG TPA: S8 family serine peptidase [Terriglobia bacterium]|nr:S8 family serine peptidase [Terriglobia bacterium]